jgi:hypothetical protein
VEERQIGGDCLMWDVKKVNVHPTKTASMTRLLKDGWEPFSVTNGGKGMVMFLRKWIRKERQPI